VSAAIGVVSLIFSISIGLMARYQFQRFDPQKVHNPSKIAFFAAVTFSCVQSIGGIGQNLLCTVTGNNTKIALIFLSFFGHWARMQCVVAILIFRLHATFRDSLFPLSAVKFKFMTCLFLTVQFLWIMEVALTLNAMFGVPRDTTEPFVMHRWIWALCVVTLVLFAALCIATVISFCNRLLSTAKELSKWTNNQRLDRKQRKIIDVSSKYLTLFLVAMLSTVTQFATASLLNFSGNDATILLGADCSVNLFCLYLQNEFASKQYHNKCRRIDAFCRWALSRNLKKHHEAIKAQRAMMGRESTADGVDGVAKAPEIGNLPPAESTRRSPTDSKWSSVFVSSIEDGFVRWPTTIRLHPPKQNDLSPVSEAVDEVMTPNESACAKDGDEATTAIEELTVTECPAGSDRAEQPPTEQTAEFTECPLSLGECDCDDSPSALSPQTDEISSPAPAPSHCRISLQFTTTGTSGRDPSWFSVAL